MKIAKIRKDWPRLPAPLTVIDVVHAGTDSEKDAMIMKWMTVVWESWADRHPWVRKTTDDLLNLSITGDPGNRAFERSYKR